MLTDISVSAYDPVAGQGEGKHQYGNIELTFDKNGALTQWTDGYGQSVNLNSRTQDDFNILTHIGNE